MKYCRFRYEGTANYGLVESVVGRETITRLLVRAPQDSAGELDEMPTRKMTPRSVDDADLLAPVEPSKIICVGRNYREHAKELGNPVPTEPLLFFKPPSSVIASGQQIHYPSLSNRVDHEGELGVLVGRTCRNLLESENARDYILGYTCLNDVTARDLQNKDGQWTRAKGFDTFCPVGPLVNTELDPWSGIKVETKVNGEVRQQGNTVDFIFPLDVIIRYISRVMTLYPGDLIATGTPSGVGPLQVGDVVEVSVENAGTLRNSIIAETSAV